MPEGPEVKRCSEFFIPFIKKELKEAVSLSDKGKFKDTPFNLLNGKTLKRVDVKGKVIVLRFGDISAISTLGMAGWWYPSVDQISQEIRERKVYYLGKMIEISEVIQKAINVARFKLSFENGDLYYCDQRNFGNFKIVSNEEADNKLNDLGLDVLMYTEQQRHSGECAKLAKAYIERFPNKTIGEALLDQSLFCGIGNIYRAESLYLAGMHPARKLSTIGPRGIAYIIGIANYVLMNAYVTESTMAYKISDLNMIIHHPDNKEQLEKALQINSEAVCRGHLVYGRSVDIFGRTVSTSNIGGRTSWYVKDTQF
jgi:formamidopyrimidine-DNA glycosylase